MAWSIPGQLESDAQGPVFDQCRIEVFFDVRVHRPEPASVAARAGGAGEGESGDDGAGDGQDNGKEAAEVPQTTERRRASTVADERGRFTLELPDEDEIAGKTLHFLVSAPSGDELLDTELTVARLQPPIRLKVRSVKPVVVGKPEERDEPEPTGLTRAVTGYVIERDGRPLPRNLQILLYASERGARSTKGDGNPVLVARADAAGYFSGEVPNKSFEDARARVSGVAEPITVPLEDGRIPPRILLVIDAPTAPEATGPGPKAGDCDCDGHGDPPRTPSQVDIDSAPGVYSSDLGTGRCVDFTTPNRAIEEFSFYTVVRTTEPDIRGLTVGGRESLPAPPAGVPVTEREIAMRDARPRVARAEGFALMEAADTSSGTAEAMPAMATTTSAEQPRSMSYAATADRGGMVMLDRINEASFARVLADDRLANLTWARDSRYVGTTPKPPGRTALDAAHPVDWDATPTFHEAATISHGHLLHFKQVWYADGYSLGDLLYSLPLAPGQKKLISVLDWERREDAGRSEDTFVTERVDASLSRDRDLGEVVSGMLTESARGGSRNTTAGAGIGSGAAGNGSYQGFNFGALMGVSGGYGESNSSAWQDSARSLSSNSLQTLRDRTLQSASAIRSLRTSVVTSVGQGEAVRATTEVVANHNHCHAVTVQYFEVLRHLKVANELVDVQECVFVPLPMSTFDRNKVLRWRQALQTYLRRPELTGGFDATRRVETNWSDVAYPADRYADELVRSVSGELLLTVVIPLPPLPPPPPPNPPDPIETAKQVTEALSPTSGILGAFLAVATGGLSLAAGAVTNAALNATQAATQGAKAVAESLMREASPEAQYARFHRDVVPGVVEGFVNTLEVYALVGSNEVRLQGADFTLVSTYQPGVPLLVSLRGTLSTPVTRDQIRQLIIKSGQALPTGCKAIINSARVRYRTDSFEHSLVNDDRVNDDLDPPTVSVSVVPPLFQPVLTTVSLGQGAALYTPTDAWEQRRPRLEDIRLSTELVEHLNDNLEYYHHAIWWTMDPNRRFMLLDGFVAPGANSRSVASVVENRLIGIVGNSLVLPVAHGVHLDPRFVPEAGKDLPGLLEHYKPRPVAPSRVSLPTRGVFAEAVMGSCNSCEKMDDALFWRWEQSPIDEPPAIEALSTATRRATPDGLAPTAFPTPIVAIQNAPEAPAPAGVGPAIEALTRQSFADITGLAGTQANAAAAYSKAMDTATAFGKEASTLAQQAAMLGAKDKALGAIDDAEEAGKIEADDARDLRLKALRKMVGDGATDERAASVADRLKVVDDAQTKGSITDDAATALRNTIMRGLDPEEVGRNEQQAATNETIRRIPGEAVERVETTEPSGKVTTITAKPVTGAITEALGGGGAAGGGGGGGGPFGVLGAALQTAMGIGTVIVPLERPTVSDRAFDMSRDKALLDSYEEFQGEGFNPTNKPTQSWFFSSNAGLDGNVRRPAAAPASAADWTGLHWKARTVLGDLGGFNANTLNPNAAGLARVTTAYAKWPAGKVAVFQGGGTAATNTCNIYVGEALFLDGINNMSAAGKYFSAADIYDGRAPHLVKIAPARLAVGDIAAWGGHVEVVHAVNHAAGTFCSLGGYLNPLGTSRCGDVSPARRFDYKDIRFFRVRP